MDDQTHIDPDLWLLGPELAEALVDQAEALEDYYAERTFGGQLQACWVSPGAGAKRFHKP